MKKKQFYQKINNVYTDTKFTYELEENGKIEFFCALIEKSSQLFISTVYEKLTISGLCTNWKSFIHFKYKIIIIKCLIERRYKICDSYNINKYTRNYQK